MLRNGDKMPGMLASLVSRLRDRIRQLEGEEMDRKAKAILKRHWDLLRRAELALLKPKRVHPAALKVIESDLEELLEVHG